MKRVLSLVLIGLLAFSMFSFLAVNVRAQVSYKIAAIGRSDFNTVRDDLDELLVEGKIAGYDLYTEANVDELWVKLDEYQILIIDEDCMFDWDNPGPDYNKPTPVLPIGVSFYNHKAELEEWIYDGGGLFCTDQNDISSYIPVPKPWTDAGNVLWTWLPDELQVESNELPSNYPEIGYGHDPWNLEVIYDPGIFSYPNKVDVTKVSKYEAHGRFTKYPGYTPLVRDKSNGDILEVYRTYGSGVIVLSHLEYETADPWDVDYVENELYLISPARKDIGITLYIEDAVKGEDEAAAPLVNKAPGDKIDIVAAVSNREEDSQDIDVLLEVPSDLGLDTMFPRKDFADIREFQFPSTIRVLRTATGQIDVVDFREYVRNVLPNEWYASWDMNALKAGAIAVKTYGWYWTIHQKYPGMGYDVRDDESDQVYKPGSANPRTDQAIEETWNWIMTKHGDIFQAQYDSGTQGSPDPLNPGRMSQWGTQYWAEKGKDWRWIVHYYYDPVNIICLSPTIDGNKYTTAISLAAKESIQLVFRFDISESASTIACPLVFARTIVEGVICSSATIMYNMVGNTKAIIVTNRHLLYKKYDDEEVNSLLRYIYKISDWREENCIVYYVDHYDESLKRWNQNVDYTNEDTANRNASRIDDFIEEWADKLAQKTYWGPFLISVHYPYLVIVGGDEIIPFYRLNDLNYVDGEEDHPYNSNDPVLHAFDENYFLSDNPYADISGDDFEEGELELSIGRIVGHSADAMEFFIRNALSGPENLDVAIVMHDEEVDDAINALDEKASTVSQSDSWTDDELEDEMEQGFQILYCVCHGEYDRIQAVGGGVLYDDELDDVDSTGGISGNRPLTIFDACRVGVVTDENEDQWMPEWDDCMVYALVNHGCSGIVAPGGLALFNYGVRLTNNYISRLITGDGETLPFGTALRDSKVHYDNGWWWDGGERKTVTEFIYFGLPWTTMDPQGALPQTASSIRINISDPSHVFNNIYAKEIEINVTEYIVSHIDSFDLLEIDGAQLAFDEHKPVLPLIDVTLLLPLDSDIVDIILADSITNNIGYYNIPSFVSAIKPNESSFEPSTGTGFYPDPIYKVETTTTSTHTEVKIKMTPITFNAETKEALLYSYSKLRLTYKTEIPVVLQNFMLQKKEYAPGESIGGLALVDSVTSEMLFGIQAYAVLKDSHDQVVASALSIPFDLSPGETKQVYILLDQELPHGTYLLEAGVIGSGTLATYSTYIKILSGGIVDLSGPSEVKSGDDITFEVSFMNGKSEDVSGESVIYLYDPHNIEIAELHSLPTIFPATSITKVNITWNTFGREYGTYTASAMVYAGGESFGPAYHTFTIKPPDEIPPATIIQIGSPNYTTVEMIYVTPETPFTLIATDNPGGSGVATTWYRIHNTTFTSPWILYSAPFNLSGLTDDIYTIDFYSIDNAGNLEDPPNSTTITLFSWNYVFEDTYGRGTILKINLAHKFFQFTTPDKDYSIRNATYMRQCGRAIIIRHYDNELRLITLAIDTKLDFCIAIAWDKQTHKQYFLIDKVGKEQN